jgi:dihydrofolate synthase/folylpolyglutamate synthase
LSEVELSSLASNYGLCGSSYSTVVEAVSAAKANAKEDDFIFIGGSTFVVADFISGLINTGS